MRKKEIISIISIITIVLLVNIASAEFWECFNHGEIINYCNPKTPDRTCGGSQCFYCMDSYNSENECFNQGNFNVCNTIPQNCGNRTGTMQIDTTPPELTIFSPEQGSIHSSRSIQLALALNERSDVYYIDNNNNRGRWTRVCKNCFSYDNKRSFKEGLNNLTFKASDAVNNEAFFNIDFYIDSKKPRISKALPRRGFASGFFEVQFKEENPSSLILYYGGNGFNNVHDLNIQEECILEKTKYICETFTNVEAYDGSALTYWFNLTDIAGASHSSKPITLDVDTTSPIINSVENLIESNRVTLKIFVTEENLESVEYKDNSASSPRFRRLCSNLKDGVCERKITLSEGSHLVDIQVTDEAGNSVGTSIELEIV